MEPKENIDEKRYIERYLKIVEILRNNNLEEYIHPTQIVYIYNILFKNNEIKN